MPLSRRWVLGAAAGGVAASVANAAGLFDQYPLHIEKTRDGLVVRTGQHVWTISHRSFGNKVQSLITGQSDEPGFQLVGLRFLGTSVAFDLDVAFKREWLGSPGGWRLILNARGFPASTSVPFVPWLLGAAEAATYVDGPVIWRLLRSITQDEVIGAGPAQLFLPDLSWALQAERDPFSLRTAGLRARAARIAPGGGGGFEQFLDDFPHTGSTAVSFENIIDAGRIDIGRDDEQNVLRLTANLVRTACFQTFERPGRRQSLDFSAHSQFGLKD